MGVLARDVVQAWSAWNAPGLLADRRRVPWSDAGGVLPGRHGRVEEGPGKAICAACLVIEDCRAMTDRAERGLSSDVFGVFAGETPLKRVRRRAG